MITATVAAIVAATVAATVAAIVAAISHFLWSGAGGDSTQRYTSVDCCSGANANTYRSGTLRLA